MRQLKNLMKAKKPMWRCGECECITLKCWRENDEFCNCGTSSEGLGVEYAFKDWDGTILKKGSIDEGATPKAPVDPTREGYTFTGWEPEVGPLSEDTTYVAQYEVNDYTVTIAVDPVAGGSVSSNSVTVSYGTAISANDNVLTIGESTITATAETGYGFSSWGTVPETVTGNTSITATFIPGPVNTAAGVVGGISLFGDASIDSDYVLIEVGTDEGTGNATVNTTAHGIYADSSLEVSGENVFVTLFNSINSDYLGIVYGGSTPNGTIQSDAYTALSNLYFNPSADNIAAAKTAIEVYENNDNESFIEWAGE